MKNKKFNKDNKSNFNIKFFIISLFLSIVVGTITYFYSSNLIHTSISFIITFIIISAINFASLKMQKSIEIKKMESVFPEFLELMSSNLRAGMTVDRALLLSSREEFSPLDKEILKLGKDLMTGKNIEQALKEMSLRIKSNKINKTISVIISGIKSGGNLATLLHETAVNVREREFVEKRAASNVLMYEILILFGIGVGAPALFALSSVLVETLTNILSNIPEIQHTSNMPFALTKISISPIFITYFSLAFIIITAVLGSLVIGTVTKGDEKAGLKYILPIVTLSIIIFFSVKLVLSKYFSGFIG